MKYLQIIFIFLFNVYSSQSFDIGKKYVLNVIDLQFSVINIKGRVIPPVDTAFEGELHLQVLSNNSYVGQFRHVTQFGNVDKGKLNTPFLIETDDDSILNVQVSKELGTKGVRYVYDVVRNVLWNYSSLKQLNNEDEVIEIKLPLGICNASVKIKHKDLQKTIDARADINKCKLDSDLITILGDDAEKILTDETFIEVNLLLNDEITKKIVVTMNIRGEDPSQDFKVAMVRNTMISYLNSTEDEIVLPENLSKYSREQILEL